MAFVWFLFFVLAVCLWLNASARTKQTERRNAALAAERTALHHDHYALQQQYAALQQQYAASHQQHGHLYQQYGALHQQMQLVQRENQDLSRYRPLVDVDGEIQRRRTVIAAAEAAAQQQAGATVAHANHQAASVISNAHSQAQAIAADALDAKRHMETYRAEASALKNVVEGYGDRYLVATETVLDGLAESFGFTEGGAQLKAARSRSRAMIKNKQAAACDYAEAERRVAAIEFVIDAFNGKADSILSQAKSDNFGTLRQELIDACVIVNRNGRAFRNARILDAYLLSRVDELRWAVTVHELREREREEQRQLKELIREEEKARREYERAQKEAAKEEDIIRRAMARAQDEIAHATDAQRTKYEAQLRELELRLHAAEEKNQRALSMAQQTKRGHVYIISNVGSFGDDVLKIGLTRRLDPLDRIKELGDASVPFDFDVHAMIVSDDAPALERALHRHFLAAQLNKVNHRKEFFRAKLSTVRDEVEKLGIQAVWTMAAEAAQYRESVAIERAISTDPTAYKAWLERQLVLDPVTVDAVEEEEELDTKTRRPVAAAAAIG